MTDIRDDLETSRSLHFAALAVAMAFPTISTWVYFLAISDAALVQPIYAASKVVQFAFPVFWVWRVQKRAIAWRKPNLGELSAGIAVGALMVAAGLGAYFGYFRDSDWLRFAPAMIGEKLTHLGIAAPGKYWAFAAFVSVPHAALEEYYWRWFCFGQLRRVWPTGLAVVVSAFAFMSHHVLVLNRFLQAGWAPTALFSLCVALGGAVWAVLYARRGSIYGPWVSHLMVDAGIMAIGADLVWGLLATQ
ncbi:MAG: CPBP family intramembrane glutamic endopeptidase [Pirellulales bacterium]